MLLLECCQKKPFFEWYVSSFSGYSYYEGDGMYLILIIFLRFFFEFNGSPIEYRVVFICTEYPN